MADNYCCLIGKVITQPIIEPVSESDESNKRYNPLYKLTFILSVKESQYAKNDDVIKIRIYSNLSPKLVAIAKFCGAGSKVKVIGSLKSVVKVDSSGYKYHSSYISARIVKAMKLKQNIEDSRSEVIQQYEKKMRRPAGLQDLEIDY